MKLSTLINHVGDDNVQVQNLFTDLHRADLRAVSGATVSFYTDPKYVLDLSGNADYIGLVVWIPRDKLPEEMR